MFGSFGHGAHRPGLAVRASGGSVRPKSEGPKKLPRHRAALVRHNYRCEPLDFVQRRHRGGCELAPIWSWKNMQYLHDDRSTSARTFGLGWKAIVFGIVVIALSIVVSVGIVQLIEPFLVS